MAATPIDPRVAERQFAIMAEFPANAHSAEHAQGAAAARAMEDAAEEVASFVQADASQVTFTPGASAALWLAVEDVLARTAGRPARIAVSAAEHPALLDHVRRAQASGCAELVSIAVDADGVPLLEEVAAVLASGVDLLCTMAANNEIGTVTPLRPIAALLPKSGALWLVDASQAAGRSPAADFADADYLVLSGAKIYGPRRVGALIADLHASARAIGDTMFGSPDVGGASALALACRLRREEGGADEQRIGAMRDRLEALLLAAVPGLQVNGAAASRLAGSLHVSVPDLPGDAVVARLWGQVSVSTGAACQSGVPGPSHVLTAMGAPDWIAEGAVRIGIGRFNSMVEIEQAAQLIAAAMIPEAARKRA